MTGLLDRILDYLATKTETPSEVFAGTRGAGLNNGDCRGVYDKWSNTVRIVFYGNKSSNGTAGEVLFTIPAAYRKTGNPGGGSILGIISGGTIQVATGWAYIDSSGQIKQNGTNYMRSIYGFIEYSL